MTAALLVAFALVTQIDTGSPEGWEQLVAENKLQNFGTNSTYSFDLYEDSKFICSATQTFFNPDSQKRETHSWFIKGTVDKIAARNNKGAFYLEATEGYHSAGLQAETQKDKDFVPFEFRLACRLIKPGENSVDGPSKSPRVAIYYATKDTRIGIHGWDAVEDGTNGEEEDERIFFLNKKERVGANETRPRPAQALPVPKPASVQTKTQTPESTGPRMDDDILAWLEYFAGMKRISCMRVRPGSDPRIVDAVILAVHKIQDGQFELVLAQKEISPEKVIASVEYRGPIDYSWIRPDGNPWLNVIFQTCSADPDFKPMKDSTVIQMFRPTESGGDWKARCIRSLPSMITRWQFKSDLEFECEPSDVKNAPRVPTFVPDATEEEWFSALQDAKSFIYEIENAFGRRFVQFVFSKEKVDGCPIVTILDASVLTTFKPGGKTGFKLIQAKVYKGYATNTGTRHKELNTMIRIQNCRISKVQGEWEDDEAFNAKYKPGRELALYIKIQQPMDGLKTAKELTISWDCQAEFELSKWNEEEQVVFLKQAN